MAAHEQGPLPVQILHLDMEGMTVGETLLRMLIATLIPVQVGEDLFFKKNSSFLQCITLK